MCCEENKVVKIEGLGALREETILGNDLGSGINQLLSLSVQLARDCMPYKQQTLLLTVLDAGKSEIMVLADWVSGKSLLPRWLSFCCNIT